MLSWTDWFKVWCEVNKVPFGGFDELPFAVYEKFMPVPDLGTEMGEMFLFVDEYGYTGGEEGVVRVQDVSSNSMRDFKAALMRDSSLAFHVP